MGININDLDNNLNPVGASLLSGNETIMDNLRELSDEELKTCGGGKKGGESIVVTGGGGGFGFGSPTVVTSGGGKKGGGSIVVTGGGGGGFPVGVPVGIPVGGFPVGGFPVAGSGGSNLSFNVGSTSNSRANSF